MPSLLTEFSLPGWDDAPTAVLDRFNERWVHTATFLSPALVIELLQETGRWTHDWYSTVDPDRTGEVVLLFGPDPAPYRAIAAREYVERWVHHLQIRQHARTRRRQALGAPPFGDRAHGVITRALATLLTMVAPADAGPIVLDLGDAVWTYRADGSGVRRVASGRADAAAVTLTVDAEIVTTLLSRGLPLTDGGGGDSGDRASPNSPHPSASVAAVSSGYYADL